MRLLSVVGLRSFKGRRVTFVHSSLSFMHRFYIFGRHFLYLLSCLILTLGIIMQGYRYPPAIRVQEYVVTFLSPLSLLFSKPYQWSREFIGFFETHSQLQMENKALKRQNDFLIRERYNTRLVHTENIKLKEALKVYETISENLITARITHQVYDGYSQTHFIGATVGDHIEKNSPILSLSGNLVGRVLIREKNHAGFMPITDMVSRVPVKIGSSSIHGLLVGTGGKECLLSHLEDSSPIQVGDKLLTSGVGGIFTPNIPVAVVTKKEGTKIIATPLGKIEDQDFVFVVSKENKES